MQHMNTKLSQRFLSVRMPLTVHKAFCDKARRYGSVSEVLRELIQAFVEDRLVVKPPVNRKESIYHE